MGFNIDNKLERFHTNIESCTPKVYGESTTSKELRPNDYNIPDTRVVCKLKLIDIFRNLKIMPLRDLIN